MHNVHNVKQDQIHNVYNVKQYQIEYNRQYNAILCNSPRDTIHNEHNILQFTMCTMNNRVQYCI